MISPMEKTTGAEDSASCLPPALQKRLGHRLTEEQARSQAARIDANKRRLRSLFKRPPETLAPKERALTKAALDLAAAQARRFLWKCQHGADKWGGVTVILKPAGDGCNYRCAYCFNRHHLDEHYRMPLEVVEHIFRKAYEALGDYASFTWHGGEPTLAGLEFFEQALALQGTIFNRPVQNCLQTNGSLLTGRWMKFLKDNNIPVGISLDGNEAEHNAFRRNKAGQGTFRAVIRAIKRMREADIRVGVVSTITAGRTDASGLYGVLRELDVHSVTANPVEPEEGLTLAPEEYAVFVIDLLERWFNDSGKGPVVRQLQNFLWGLVGTPAPTCHMSGTCSYFFSIQGDGWVKTCCDRDLDRSRTPEAFPGNIQEEGLKDILEGQRFQAFAGRANEHPPSCNGCEWFSMCGGGCSHLRFLAGGSFTATDPYCPSYKRIFSYLQSTMDSLDN